MRDSRGETGGPKPSEKIRFLNNTGGPDPLKNRKARYQARIQYGAMIDMPAKRHLNWLIMAHTYWHLDPPSPHKLKKN